MPQPLACHQPVNADRAQLYETLVSELTDFAVFLTDATGCIVSWNPGVERLFGYAETEWLGRNIELIFTPEDRAEGVPQQEIDTALQKGRAGDNRWHLHKNGQRLYVNGTLVALRDDAGRLLGFSKIAHDISGSRRREQQLRDALNYAENIIDTIREPMLILDAQLRVVSANRSFYEVFGVLKSETEQQPLYALGDGQWAIPQLRHLLEEILPQTATIEDFEVEHDFPKIGRKVMRLNARKLWREGNHTELILLAMEDFTGRKRNEEELKQAAQRQSALVQLGDRLREHKNFSSIIYTSVEVAGTTVGVDRAGYGKVDEAGECVGVDAGWSDGGVEPLIGCFRLADFGEGLAAQLGRGERVFVGDVREDLLTRDKREQWEALRIRSSLTVPLLKNGKLDALVFLVHSEPRVWTEEEITFVCKVADRAWAATERESIWQDLQRSNEDLAQFAHVAAHDLQAPLRGIVNYSQLLRRQATERLDVNEKEFLDVIVESAQQMQVLIQALLRFAQVGQGAIDKKPLSMEAVLNTAVHNLYLLVEERQAKIVGTALPVLRGDAVQLTQLLQNLISNAINYSRPGEAPQIEVSATRENHYYIFGVKDNGQGIAREHHQRVFKPLQRLHGANIPGTGLGLTACLRIVERHGGRMWIESEPGDGSIFYFTIPAD